MRRLFLIIVILFSVSVIITSCGGKEEKATYILSDDTTPPPAKKAPALIEGAEVHYMKSNIVSGRLADIFKEDSNIVQLQAAQANGINPISKLSDAYKLKRPIVPIYTCDDYYVDENMSHSLPYLVPKAATLLKEIAHAFRDTIKARGGKEYRIRVNSLLRTEYSVAKLQKQNSNATQHSCHLYATTFDISWTKFDCMDPSYQISLESLKNILAEIIYDFRAKGRCYAIFEMKKGCFHLTVR